MNASLSALARHGRARDAEPRCERWQVWTEIGTWSTPGSLGVPYRFSAIGLTDAEFWRLAESLHPNQL